MRKADLVNLVSDKTGIPKVDVLLTIEGLFKEIKETVVKGDSVFLRGFGTFYPKHKAAKIGRIVKRNIAMNIPEHFVPGYKPAKEFKLNVQSKCTKNNRD